MATSVHATEWDEVDLGTRMQIAMTAHGGPEETERFNDLIQHLIEINVRVQKSCAEDFARCQSDLAEWFGTAAWRSRVIARQTPRAALAQFVAKLTSLTEVELRAATPVAKARWGRLDFSARQMKRAQIGIGLAVAWVLLAQVTDLTSAPKALLTAGVFIGIGQYLYNWADFMPVSRRFRWTVDHVTDHLTVCEEWLQINANGGPRG